jgi:hypothetical protein
LFPLFESHFAPLNIFGWQKSSDGKPRGEGKRREGGDEKKRKEKNP